MLFGSFGFLGFVVMGLALCLQGLLVSECLLCEWVCCATLTLLGLIGVAGFCCCLVCAGFLLT